MSSWSRTILERRLVASPNAYSSSLALKTTVAACSVGDIAIARTACALPRALPRLTTKAFLDILLVRSPLRYALLIISYAGDISATPDSRAVYPDPEQNENAKPAARGSDAGIFVLRDGALSARGLCQGPRIDIPFHYRCSIVLVIENMLRAVAAELEVTVMCAGGEMPHACGIAPLRLA